MNTFYQQSEKTQQIIGWLMILLLAACLIGWYSMEHDLLKGALVFIIIPLYLFLSTPIFTFYKKYNYLSPMLMFMERKEETYELHSGTSFDYLFAMKGVRPGKHWKNKMLLYYIEGLSEIINRIKNGKIPESSTIKGTSYFMGNSLMKKLGFDLLEAEPMDKFNFCLDYLDLVWMHSMANGKLRFPRFKNLKKAVISGEQLLDAESTINQYKAFLKKRTNTILGII